MKPRTLLFLDHSYGVLLNGHGEPLEPGHAPVYVEVTEDEAPFAVNSKGERFHPPWQPDGFVPFVQEVTL